MLFALTLIFPLVMVLAMISDLRKFEIPDALSLLLVVAFVPVALLAGRGWVEIAWTFGLAALVLLAGIGLFMAGVMGGGDGKLLAAATLWTGREQLAEFLILTALAGGAVALTLLLFRRWPLADGLRRIEVLRRLHERKKDVPYAVGIGAAGLMVYPNLPLLAG
ncbi:MAG: prepilin peptidase [Alphaproteobacteria bacterium]|nr:prepilin peptidase [Alphaproteobacteria bacterium]MDP6564141.1 prepilin peptidase [Alphaproteobacteria bacterium]MDP6812659.1 prepilin peptidase [Alphaproteobacteria bacterium]